MEEFELQCPVCQRYGELVSGLASRVVSTSLRIAHDIHRTNGMMSYSSSCVFEIPPAQYSVYELESMYREYVRDFRTQHNYAEGHLYRAVKNLPEWFWMFSEWHTLTRLSDKLEDYPRWLTNRLTNLEVNLCI